ncbi:CoA transferase [Alsobacter metallidurans]|uniref:CoA transferase n=1 Tax=Alsobacter metallidurans TaxID=340221 RepID=A0A917I7Z0_9HYPH|nr:CaiB/BaiF CoA-transferase family protein [Alsobacter metallidurans]GGH21120.1 CoA transferase [Alsobacter metallidurans]
MGPLHGLKIVEMSSIGPAPYCGMLLADMGAQVIRIDRLEAADLGFPVEPRFDLLNRGKQAAAVDLKLPDGAALVLDLVGRADALIEGFRPGVMERLGLGPDACLAANPRLVYGRMTGWGQTGPLSGDVGHDINYIALSGVLQAIGPAEGPPVPPLNLVGDFGGGALFLAMGMLAALLEARGSGVGQVVDAAMVDGAASLMTMHHGYVQAGLWTDRRGDCPLGGAAPWYSTYETLDRKHVAVGAIEGRFYRALVRGLGLEGAGLPGQHDRARWGALRAAFAGVFATRTRDQWADAFAGTDACVTPVLDCAEAAAHPHARARGAFVDAGDGVHAPAPAPRFSRTPGAVAGPPADARARTRESLRAWGLADARLDALAAAGAIAP